MQVHVVNPANREYYSDYVDEMFRIRKEVFIDTLNWSELKAIDGKEIDEADSIEEVEYLLVTSKEGELIGCCRFNPTTKPHLLNGPLKQYIQRDVELGPDVWEFTRFAPTRNAKSPHRFQALGLLCAGAMEWALTKGVKRLLGLGEDNLVILAQSLGWQTRLLGMPIEYEPGKTATAMEFKVERKALDSTRAYFNIDKPALYIAPPPMENNKITSDQMNFLDCALRIYHQNPGKFDYLDIRAA